MVRLDIAHSLPAFQGRFVLSERTDFKFGTQVDCSKSQPIEDKLSLKKALCYVTQFNPLPPSISKEWLKLELSNLVHR